MRNDTSLQLTGLITTLLICLSYEVTSLFQDNITTFIKMMHVTLRSTGAEAHVTRC